MFVVMVLFLEWGGKLLLALVGRVLSVQVAWMSVERYSV